MWKLVITAFISLCLTACVNKAGARMGLISATAPVIAILHDDLFTGTAEGYLDRTGTIDVVSKMNPDIRCVGEFRYTGSSTGKGEMQCNDGSEARFSFNALSSLSGYGYGKSSRGALSFTFGLTVEDAREYLKLPSGKLLKVTPDKLPELTSV